MRMNTVNVSDPCYSHDQRYASIDVARIFRDGCIRPGGPRGPILSKGAPFAPHMWSQPAPGAPAEKLVLIGVPYSSKELSFLQEASCAFQENLLRRLRIDE